MRSRPRVRAHFVQHVLPGEPLRVTIRLESKERTPYDAIELELIGRERLSDARTNANAASPSAYHDRVVLARGVRLTAGVLERAPKDFHVEFAVPHDLPPSRRSSLSHVEYTLSVRVRIPWWLDRLATYGVVVEPPATAVPPVHPVLYTTNAQDHSDQNPVVELSLENDASRQVASCVGRSR